MIPAGVTDLFASERGVFAIALLAICTAFVLDGRMTVEQWSTYTQWIGVALIASKTVTTAIATLVSPPVPATSSTPAPPPKAPAP